LPSFAQVVQPPQKLPVVKSGDLPFYPQLPRVAQIEGDVRLRITTDGLSVRSVTVDSGQPMLARAAQDNVKTWKFEPHAPTSFSTLFSYHLVKETVTYSCDPDVPDNGTVVLRLPAEVEITSRLRIRDCYDANEELDLTEPLRVFLTGCEVDGSPTSCERVTFRLYSGSLVVAPTRFREPKREGFVVPKEFRNLKNYSLTVEIGTESFKLSNEDIGFLKGKWHVGIDHAPFKEQTPVYNVPAALRCVGFIVFEWGEPEVAVSAPCQ
jgi:TonB family protein